jgi:hypothetical protein
MSMAETSTHTDSLYLGVLKNISFQPVFIMGDHRSGTTLLYQMLDAAQCFNVVRAYPTYTMPSELTQLRDQIVALEREINANMHRKFPQSASPALPSAYPRDLFVHDLRNRAGC